MARVNSREQMTFLVKSLSPNTTYFFRIRGGNGCAVGIWGNEISAKTKSNISFNDLQITESQLEVVDETEEPLTGKDTSEVETQKPDVPKESGYKVNVKVVDANKKPIEGATVTLHSNPQTTKTNKEGIAEFKNVEKGEHKVLIAYNNFKGEQTVNLTGDVKEFNLNVTVKQKAVSLSPLAYIIIGVLALVIVALAVILLKLKKSKTVFK